MSHGRGGSPGRRVAGQRSTLDTTFFHARSLLAIKVIAPKVGSERMTARLHNREHRYRRSLAWALVSCVGLVALMTSCSDPAEEPLFTLLTPEETGIAFENTVVEQEGFNVLEYEYFYNGAGVAAGDINNDGLPDLFFSANLVPDRLYLNQGDLTFEDITERAGLENSPTWTTGVTMADVNADGWLDIYVCRSGNVASDRRRNVLYINNGDLSFTEQAAEYGLDRTTYSNHAAFFDYDRDGDLDAYLLNHSIRRYSKFVVDYMRNQRDSLAGDMLLRNDDGWFTDVSEKAGIIGNPLGFGLAAIVSDINRDGWLDLFVSNDYIEDDYLYINQQDGTFAESIRSHLTHTSYSSMGADIADINNDGVVDIVTLDMLAEDHYRQKILKGPEDYRFYAQMREDGFHEQYMRNMLHISQDGRYVEIGQLAGISNTDWSWAALLADFDLDGYKDLFITNGYLRDYTNLDFLKTTLVDAYREASARGETLSSLDMVQRMPSSKLKNYMFRNRADWTFENRTEAWAMDQPTVSSGAAVADLDADGDLDLIVNNINEPAFVYRNEATDSQVNHFLRVLLEGPEDNRLGIGANVMITGGTERFYQEMIPGRGYLSAVEPVLVFGLGQLENADLQITWPDGRRQTLSDVAANQTLVLRHADADAPMAIAKEATEPLFTEIAGFGLDYRHEENPFVDFDREPLLPHVLSREGPALAAGDINGDGLEDLIVGGAMGSEAGLFLQQADGSFRRVSLPALSDHRGYEDTEALLFDADGDGDIDLYMVSGGNSEEEGSALYQDRLYENEGFGRLVYRPGALPSIPTSGTTVAAHDMDNDGDLDLFVGGRVRPGRYPLAPQSYLLENTGGEFRDVTAEHADALVDLGMVTDALWVDIAGDDSEELVIAGEWQPIRVFAHDNGRAFTEITDRLGLGQTNGFWNVLAVADLDGDGDTDLVAGNRGVNTQISMTAAEPASLYAVDVDHSGTVLPLMSAFIGGQEHPVIWRDQLVGEAPSFAVRFPTYASYADATMQKVLTSDERAGATTLHAFTSETSLFENRDDAGMRRKPLPVAVQAAPVQDILVGDYNDDGIMDLLLAGNNYGVRAEVGRDAAGRGLVLLGAKQGDLSFHRAGYSGFIAPGDVRKIAAVRVQDIALIVVATNDDLLRAFAPSHTITP